MKESYVLVILGYHVFIDRFWSVDESSDFCGFGINIS